MKMNVLLAVIASIALLTGCATNANRHAQNIGRVVIITNCTPCRIDLSDAGGKTVCLPPQGHFEVEQPWYATRSIDLVGVAYQGMERKGFFRTRVNYLNQAIDSPRVTEVVVIKEESLKSHW